MLVSVICSSGWPSWGCDPAAKDASRVLRLVNTVNSKSGEVCRVLHVGYGSDSEPLRYNFEYLAEVLLPKARWELEAERTARTAVRGRFKLLPSGQNGNMRTFSGRQLAWNHFDDLRLRGGMIKGERLLRHLF